MENDGKILEKIKVDILKRIRSIIPRSSVTFHELAQAKYEEAIKEILLRVLLDNTKYLIKKEYEIIDQKRIKTQGIIYDYKLCDEIDHDYTLSIFLDIVSPIEEKYYKKKISKKTVSLSKLGGHYKKFRILTPHCLINVINKEYFLHLIKILYEVCYRWLNECLSCLLEKEEKDFTKEIYGYLRSSLPDKIANEVWLLAVTKGKGAFLFDKETGKKILTPNGVSAKSEASGKIQMLAKVINTILPYEVMNAREAITQRKCYDFNLYSSKYRNDELDFLLSYEGISESRVHSIYPIVCSGKIYVVLFFPSKHRTILDPLLAQHVEQLANIVRNFTGKFYITQPQLVCSSFYSKLGEFAGGMVKAFIEK